MPDIKRSLTRQSLVVAGVCVATDLGLFLVLGVSPSCGWQVWLVLGGLVAADAALALPARHSGTVVLGHAVLVVGAVLLLAGLDGMKVPNNSGMLIAGFQAGAWLRTPRALLALGTMTSAMLTADLLAGRYGGDWRVLVFAGIVPNTVLPWLVGRYTTARRAYLAGLEAEAELRRRDERVAVQRAVAEERSALARDLHDVISHHVSAISMHAGAARLAGVADGPARRSLVEVESASRSAMVELRRMLDLLHGQDSGASQPGLDGIAATAAILAAGGHTRVLVLTTYDLDDYVYRALRAGASGFLLKGTPPEELVSAIRVAARGDALIDPAVTRRLLTRFTASVEPPARPPELERLTAREREVLLLIADARSNAEIAAALCVGEETVKTHVSRVLAKLGLRDRVHAVAYAYRHGLVDHQ